MKIDVEAMFDLCRTQQHVELFEIAPFDLQGLTLLAEDVAAMRRDQQDFTTALNWLAKHITLQVLLHRRILDNPSLAETPLPRPVFIIAPGRTGSTLLQWLLALEPSLRSPLLWELWSPLHGGDQASRRDALRGAKDLIKASPARALKLHPLVADAPDECHWILRHNSIRAGMHRIPRYGEWLWSLDAEALTALLKDYRRLVQVMQAENPARIWLSKTFAHMHYWPVLFDVFPDARVIRIHRDPRESIVSACNLTHALARGLDPMMIGDGAEWAAFDGQTRMLYAEPRNPPGQVVDIMYEELRTSPVAVTRRLAEWLEVPDPEAFQARVERYLATPTRLKATPHGAELEEFGLNGADMLDRFAPYIDWVRARLDPQFCR